MSICALLVAVAPTCPALALQYISGQITQLEPTYMPDKIALQMNAGNAACPAGKWLWWVRGTSEHKDLNPVYATLLAALLAGKRVNFVITDNDSSCTGQFLHILS